VARFFSTKRCNIAAYRQVEDDKSATTAVNRETRKKKVAWSRVLGRRKSVSRLPGGEYGIIFVSFDVPALKRALIRLDEPATSCKESARRANVLYLPTLRPTRFPICRPAQMPVWPDD
jgi:hypothetical protein